ncbi:MAG: HAMP domain-containing sensor histidine kinase [Gemmatimonadota bacterium]
MFDRLLDQLESPRRHLTFLVGLLALTFVFTGLLAREARRAEMSRQATAQGVLQDMVAGAAQQWGDRVQTTMYGSLDGAMKQSIALLIADPMAPLHQVEGLAELDRFCVDCRSEITSPVFHDIEIVPGEAATHSGSRSAIIGTSILEQVRAGNMAAVHKLFYTALYVVPDSLGGPVPVAAYIATDANRHAVRVIAFEVPIALIREFLTISFSKPRLLPPTLSNALPKDSFFVARASVGGVEVLPGAANAGFSASDTLGASGPIPGLQLSVGVRPNAERKLVIGGTSTARLSLLLALLTTIAGLIILALLLVRREAELVRLRADFISGVSHELRTPLAQIRMFTETLLLGRVRSDLERRRSLEIIDQEARRLTHLVENVLLFSKTEGGRDTRLAPEPTPFAGEIRRAVESFGPMCRSRDVEIRTELQDNITAAVDRGALRQILVNLVDNALKYGPAHQRITVGVALFENVARVWVDDEGPGIPQAERDRVFESFHRLQRDIELRTAGSGIGLAVVRELARLHGGQAWAEDAPGRGARVVVQFPGAYLRVEPSTELAAAS